MLFMALGKQMPKITVNSTIFVDIIFVLCMFTFSNTIVDLCSVLYSMEEEKAPRKAD